MIAGRLTAPLLACHPLTWAILWRLLTLCRLLPAAWRLRAGLRGQVGPDRAFAPPALALALVRVRANDGAPGGDGVCIREFDRTRRWRLAALSQALADGSYRPGPLRRVPLPKPGGGVRELAIPCVADRVAQTAWLLALGPTLDRAMSPDSFGYRPRRSVAQALARARGHVRRDLAWVVDADIRAFFDSVPHAPLLAELGAWIEDARMRELAVLWLSRAAPSGRGLPQGSPISPLLANILLDPLDRELAEAGIAHVRYADDVLVFCRKRAEAQAALARVERHLAARGLHLHAGKTRVVRAEAGVAFLGQPLVPPRRPPQRPPSLAPLPVPPGPMPPPRAGGLSGLLRRLRIRG